VNEKAVRNLTLVNVGRFIFDYSWELKYPQQQQQSQSPGLLSISPVSGSIAQADKADCVLSFVPSQPLTLRRCDLSLRVRCCIVSIILLCSFQVLFPPKTALNMLNNVIDRAFYRIFKCTDNKDIKFIRMFSLTFLMLIQLASRDILYIVSQAFHPLQSMV